MSSRFGWVTPVLAALVLLALSGIGKVAAATTAGAACQKNTAKSAVTT
mgnify:CR=1 FL=1